MKNNLSTFAVITTSSTEVTLSVREAAFHQSKIYLSNNKRYNSIEVVHNKYVTDGNNSNNSDMSR